MRLEQCGRKLEQYGQRLEQCGRKASAVWTDMREGSPHSVPATYFALE